MRPCLSLAAIMLAGGMTAPAALAQNAAPPVYVQPLSQPAVRLVQDHLRQSGNYNGPVDGVWGADSQSALEHFQQTHGLQVTGQLNQATVTTLGLTPADMVGTPAPAATPAAAPAALSPRAIRAVQARLRELNFYSGNPDGVMGADTQAAVEHFQQGRGLAANGQLNAATIAALGLDPNTLMTQSPR